MTTRCINWRLLGSSIPTILDSVGLIILDAIEAAVDSFYYCSSSILCIILCATRAGPFGLESCLSYGLTGLVNAQLDIWRTFRSPNS